MSVLKDLRVIILIIAIVLSVIAINPHYEDGSLKTDIKWGLDFVGGSRIQLKLEGSTVEIQSSKEEILSYVLGDEYELTDSGEEYVEFTAEDINATPLQELEEYGTPSIEGSTLRITTSDVLATTEYLEERRGSEIEVISLEEGKYEIQGTVLTDEEIQALEDEGLGEEEIQEKSKEKLRSYLTDVDATLISYEDHVSSFTTDQTRDVLQEKLNGAGLKDISVTVWGGYFLSIDLAGVPLPEARTYVTEPGKFEIRIFINDTKTERICTGAGITEIGYTRKDMQGNWVVPFTLSDDAAEMFAQAAVQYGAVDTPEAHMIGMYLDDEEVFKAPLSPSLAVEIKNGIWQGGGLSASLGTGDESMKRARELEIHLNAGALPVKPVVASAGWTDPLIGEETLRQIFIAIIFAILAVGVIIYLRYRERKIVIPLLITGFSETLIVLGIATQIQQLDLPALGGIIATLGTGVDQLVIITDEVLRGERVSRKGLVKRVAAAFSIIFASAATTVIAMTPLAYMQLGVLRGFAIVTIIGILVGIFITRPAYGNMIKKILGR
jgi:preprotein translocase subunit SecD